MPNLPSLFNLSQQTSNTGVAGNVPIKNLGKVQYLHIFITTATDVRDSIVDGPHPNEKYERWVRDNEPVYRSVPRSLSAMDEVPPPEAKEEEIQAYNRKKAVNQRNREVLTEKIEAAYRELYDLLDAPGRTEIMDIRGILRFM